MLYKVRQHIRIFCMVIMCSIVMLSHSICLADNNNTVDMNQDVRWISLNLPVEQRNMIDEVIAEQYKQIKNLQKNQEITDIGNSEEFLRLVNYMSRMNEIQNNMNDQIVQLLPFDQRDLYDNESKARRQVADKATATLLALNLSKVQQTKIINILIRAKKKSWSTLADTSTPWERRVSRLKRADTFKQISAILDKNQRITWGSWNGVNITR